MATATPGESPYLALTTYRRDGRPVTTPRLGGDPGRKGLHVTAASTGKAKRIRATGVRLAPCSVSGRDILGHWREGTGGSSTTRHWPSAPWRPCGASRDGGCPWRSSSPDSGGCT